MSIGAVGFTSLPDAVKAAEAGGRDGAAFCEALQKASESGDASELKKACVQFEAYFFQMMLREMRKTVFSGSGRGREEEIFLDMLDEERSKIAAQADGLGLARQMFEQMRRQGVSG
jgi:Rod binding domain-containing protein